MKKNKVNREGHGVWRMNPLTTRKLTKFPHLRQYFEVSNTVEKILNAE
jgi:hypothetical protein